MSAEVRVRFAPSPTGMMHMGNARTALFNWLFARKHKGKFILRIEDTDAARSTEESIDHILNDLRWLQLKWDEGFDKGGEYGPYRQSDRSAVYNKHLSRLKEQGTVYECYCSPEELEAIRQEQLAKGQMPRYDNRCRDLSVARREQFQRAGRKPVLRFRVPDGQKVVFDDIIRGPMSFDTSHIGDFVLLKSNGDVTFHFAVTVDDACMHISHVIRGEDHLTNTARHVLLFQAMDYPLPRFAHLPMILGPDGAKLSKRNGLVSMQSYRDEGYLPEALANYMCFLGWSPQKGHDVLSLGDMVEQFSLEEVSHAAATFDMDKLRWINSHHIRAMDADRLTLKAQPYLKDAQLITGDLDESQYSYVKKVVQALQGNIERLGDIIGQAAVFFKDSLDYAVPEVKDVLQKSDSKKVLRALRDALKAKPEVSVEDVKNILKAVAQESGMKGKALYLPVRLALTASHDGAELYNVIDLLGTKRCVERLDKAILV